MHQEHSTRRAREEWHRGGRQVWGASSGGKRRQGPGLRHDAICAERCLTSLSRSQASHQQRRPRRRRG